MITWIFDELNQIKNTKYLIGSHNLLFIGNKNFKKSIFQCIFLNQGKFSFGMEKNGLVDKSCV
jgi:hypothetical protein